MRKNPGFLACLLSCVLGMTLSIGFPASVAYAEPSATAANFLLVPVGGRANALGGAYAALADDAYAMHFNPGALGVAPQQLAFAHNEYFLDLNQEYLSYVHPLDVGTIGVSVNYFDLGNFSRTFINNTADPNNSNSVSTGAGFDASNYAISLGYGRPMLMDGLNLGVTVKYVREEIAEYDDATVAADLGAYWREKGNPLSVGFAVTNLGDKLRLKAKDDDLPITFRLGAAYRMMAERFLVTADVQKTVKDDDIYVHAGGEYWVANMLALRVGYDHTNEIGSGLTAGAGFKMDRFTLDYAWADYDELDMSHRISLQYNF